MDIGFRAAYRDLEARMKALAEADGDVYFPTPSRPTASTTSSYAWSRPSVAAGLPTPTRPGGRWRQGSENFVNSIDDFLLHFSIRRYLCKPNERYHITDWSKGAIPTRLAGADRGQRYDRWYPLLVEEVDLVASSGARIFAVGKQVAWHLDRRAFPRPVTQVMHYSPLAALARAAIAGHDTASSGSRVRFLSSSYSRRRKRC